MGQTNQDWYAGDRSSCPVSGVVFLRPNPDVFSNPNHGVLLFHNISMCYAPINTWKPIVLHVFFTSVCIGQVLSYVKTNAIAVSGNSWSIIWVKCSLLQNVFGKDVSISHLSHQLFFDKNKKHLKWAYCATEEILLNSCHFHPAFLMRYFNMHIKKFYKHV